MKRTIIAGIVAGLFNEQQDGTQGGDGGAMELVAQAPDTQVQPEQQAKPVEGEVLAPEKPMPVFTLPDGAKISYQDLGKKRATEVAKLDERIVATRTTLRADIASIIEASPPESWGTYIAGFTAVMADMEAKGHSIQSLRNVKSQVTRVMSAAKADKPKVLAQLKDEKQRWEQVLKALPKRSNAGRPPADAQPEAGKGASIPAPAVAQAEKNGEISEVNIPELIERTKAHAKRLMEVSIGKGSPFGQFIAHRTLKAIEIAEKDFHKTFADTVPGGKLNPELTTKLYENLGIELRKAA